MKVLLVCTGSALAYQVLRCAALDGRKVYVMGDDRSIGIRASRYCARYLASRVRISLENLDNIAGQINAFTALHGIAVVIPGDSESTRVLAAAKSLIESRLFPLPNASVLDRLGNKWTFKKLCDELDVPSPESCLLASKGELADALKASGGAGWIVKPVDREGGSGFVKFDGNPLVDQIALVDYEPILMQAFVPGQDLCISLFCLEGEPYACAVYTRQGPSIRFTRHDDLERHAARIAAHFQYSGVLCFDARLGPDGKVTLIECNPRFWNNIDAAMICGVNFVELGLRSERPAKCLRVKDGTEYLNVTGVRREMIRSGKVSAQNLRVLLHWLKDYSFWLPRLLGNRHPF